MFQNTDMWNKYRLKLTKMTQILNPFHASFI